jgi:LacI family transcriptional regulator
MTTHRRKSVDGDAARENDGLPRLKSARRGRRRPHVALLVETSLASGRDILRGIAGYVREHRTWALFHEPHGLEDSAPRWLRRWRGDGIIARVQTAPMAQEIAATGIPVVDALGVVPDTGFPLVHVDDAAIARMAAEHLLERGLRQFAFFGIEGENWSEQRFTGFCLAVAAVSRDVARYDLPRDSSGVRSWERVGDRLARWIASLPKPTGVLVCSDQRGAQFLEACRRARVAVPDEIAVISVDNDEPLCEVCDPPLSSILASHARVGYEAAALLDDLLCGVAAPRQPILIAPQQVIARRSTDTLAIDDPSIAAALRLIREHAHTSLHVDAIAHEINLSRSVLQRRFRARLKRSVQQEIIAAKIHRARDLLINTDLPLAAVAERAGFKHQEYMGAVLKARLGTTPARLRRISALGR